MTKHVPAAEFAALEIKSAEGEPVELDLASLATRLDNLTAAFEARKPEPETKSADLGRLVGRLDKVEAKLARPGIITADSSAPPVEVKAFASYLRAGTAGVQGMDPVERKSLSVGTDAAGGYLAPDQFTTDFVRDLTLFSPIRAIADVKPSSSHTVLVPKRTAITNALWQGEAVATTGSQPAFGQLAIEIKNLATHVDMNNQLLDDAVIDVQDEVRLALAEDFGEKEGTAFVNGDGVLQPKGFMMSGDVQFTLNGHATSLSPDALISIMYALAPAYRSRGTWVMNGSTLAIVRKLKDNQNNYLWQPGIQAGQPETILGRPVVEAKDMPDVAANAFPIAFGDFKTGYRIYDRKAMDVKTNPYLLMTQDQTRVHAWRRTGADVVQPKAIRKLKMATS